MRMLRLFSLFLIAGLSYLCVSCAQAYFTRPLPVDAQNKYKFPASLRGTYSYQADVAVGVTKKAFIEFEHKNFILEHVDTVILDNRTEALIHKPSGSFQKRDGKLNFYEFSKSSFELNQDQFLRKASKDVYVLNEQKGSHWEVNPIVRKSAREVYVLYLKKEDIPSDFKRLENGEVDVSWTKKEILQKIEEGLFSRYRTYYKTNRRYIFERIESETINLDDY